MATANDFAAFGKARVAAANGNVTTAAAQYGIALTAAPASQIVAQRAFRQAMAAGDLPLARRAAAVMGTDQPYDARVLALADAIQGGNDEAIDITLAGLDKTPLDFFAPIVRAWLNVGKAPYPAAALDDVKTTGAIRHIAMENRILLLLAQGDLAGGARGVESELANDSGGLDLRYSAAELLKGQGQDALAQQLLGGAQPEVVTVRDRIAPAKGSAAFGIARLFSRIAADLNDVNTTPVAVSLTRAALILDPHHDRARLLLGAALERLNAHDRALAVLDEIGPTSAFRTLAQAGRVEILRDRGDASGALAAAKALSNTPDADASSAVVYGNMLIGAERPLEAAVAYEAARDRQGADAGWQIWLQIAAAYERGGSWPLARAAFERALALGPEQAVLLNAYGYALVVRGDEMPRALAMLERAYTMAPGQPAIADSLAWAYFRSGDLAKALPLLEAASTQAPRDPDIAEHLGDVYWAAGRRFDARYSWRAARLVAEPEAVARLDAKILDGPVPAKS